MSDIVGKKIWCYECRQERTVDSQTLVVSKFEPAVGYLRMRYCGHQIKLEYMREER